MPDAIPDEDAYRSVDRDREAEIEGLDEVRQGLPGASGLPRRHFMACPREGIGATRMPADGLRSSKERLPRQKKHQ